MRRIPDHRFRDFVCRFSPERACRRARFRSAAELFAYDGANSRRRTDGWHAAGGDANTEVGASLISLRNRSRDLLRNNPYATKAIAELVGNPRASGEMVDQGREFAGLTLVDMARESLDAAGVKTRGMSRNEIARVALQGRNGAAGYFDGAMTTSDFPNILAPKAK